MSSGAGPGEAPGATLPRRSYYGWRARLGLIVPALNVVMEPELARLAPAGVSLHTTRLLLSGGASVESYRAMGEGARRAGEELASAEVDVVIYGCTAGSTGEEGYAVRAALAAATRAPVVTTSDAVTAALCHLGARRLAVATPYIPEVNALEQAHLEHEGFQVVAIAGLGLGATPESRRAIGHQPPSTAYALARQVDRPEADAVFIACTNFATLEVLGALERDLGKPVVSSNQATCWAALRAAGVRTPLAGFGRLLEQG